MNMSEVSQKGTWIVLVGDSQVGWSIRGVLRNSPGNRAWSSNVEPSNIMLGI